jgi:hypothetical protein
MSKPSKLAVLCCIPEKLITMRDARNRVGKGFIRSGWVEDNN